MIFRLACVAVVTSAGYWSIRLAWADRLSRDSRLASRERAVQLAPLSATLYGRLADLRDELTDLQSAASLDPANARRFERLGQQAEMAGDFALAERSLLRAAELSRLYQPRYLLAQYYFRRQNPAEWEQWSREALATAPGDVTPLLELAWRMTPDGSELAGQGIKGRTSIARQFLYFLVRNGQTAAATPLALHLAETGAAADLPALFRYCEQGLANADVASAKRVWNILCVRKLIPFASLDNAPITNPDFAYPTTGSAFDWHIEPPTGIRVRQAHNGLHVGLSGTQPDSCVIAWQYVPLRLGTTYRLRPTGGEGLGWSVFYPSAGGWSELPAARSLRFEAPADVVRLVMAYRRPSGGVSLEGVTTLHRVALEIEP